MRHGHWPREWKPLSLSISGGAKRSMINAASLSPPPSCTGGGGLKRHRLLRYIGREDKNVCGRGPEL